MLIVLNMKAELPCNGGLAILLKKGGNSEHTIRGWRRSSNVHSKFKEAGQ